LIIGVLLGTTVVKQSVIDDLRRRADTALNATDRLRADVNDLNSEVQEWEAFGRSAEPLLVSGRLTGSTMVMVTTQGSDPATVDGVRGALRDAGAEVAAVLVLTPRMALPDEQARSAMAQVLGVADSTPPADLSRQAAARLGERLVLGPPTDAAADVVRLLASSSFLQVAPGSAIDGLGGPDQPVIVLSGGQAVLAPAPDAFDLPLLTSLVQQDHPVAAAEAEVTANALVSLVRGDAALDGAVLTVDNVDSMPGRIALVVGLEGVLDANLGACGDFGVKTGACALLPQPSPTP
ncbi:MAG: copper transporter, partial [Actinomycetota bacterium]